MYSSCAVLHVVPLGSSRIHLAVFFQQLESFPNKHPFSIRFFSDLHSDRANRLDNLERRTHDTGDMNAYSEVCVDAVRGCSVTERATGLVVGKRADRNL